MKNAHTPQAAAPTPIVLLACGSRDATVLEMIIHRFLAAEFVIVGQSRAELAIIDGDSANAKKAMVDWRVHRPEAVTLMLTLKPGVDTPQLVHFRKPIDVDSLIAVLKKLRSALLNPVAPLPSFRVARPTVVAAPAAPAPAPAAVKEIAPARPVVHLPTPKPVPVAAKPVSVAAVVSSPVSVPEPISAHHQVSLMDSNAQDIEGRDYCGSAEDLPADLLHTIDCLRTDQAIQLYFDPDTRLLGLLRLAGKLAQTSKQATYIRGLERPLVILPDTPMSVVSPIKEGALRALCNTSLFSETVGLGIASPHHPDDVTYGYDELLWKVTLWTARGRLPRGADPHQPVRLRSSPDFARFTATPYAEAICRLWTKEEGLSPVATAARLRIAQRYVFALYSALCMLDLLEMNSTPRVGEPAPLSYADAAKTAPPLSRRGLLQGILTKLDNAA